MVDSSPIFYPNLLQYDPHCPGNGPFNLISEPQFKLMARDTLRLAPDDRDIDDIL